MWNGAASDARAGWVPVPSGTAYRLASPPSSALVVPALAEELRRVLERFAQEAGFNEQQPVSVLFKPGVVGHHQVGRAADIYAVAGVGLEVWKQRWDEALRQAAQARSPQEREAVLT